MRMADKTSGLTINEGCVRGGSKQINRKPWQDKLESRSRGISDGNEVTRRRQNSSLCFSYNCGIAGYERFIYTLSVLKRLTPWVVQELLSPT